MNHSSLVGIYLAAGKSSRMGRAKLNLPVGNQFLGSMAFRAALESKLDCTIAVTREGDSLEWLAPFSKNKSWSYLECLKADRGQSASLKAGVRMAADMGATGVVVLLADQPFITSEMINRLVDEFKISQKGSYVSFSHEGMIKPPVLFAKSFFPMLFELTGDQGARTVIREEMREQGKQIEINSDLYFFDIDTEEEYQLLMQQMRKK